jgi:hypothetical protein
MSARNITKLACLAALIASSSACYTTVLRSGKPANAPRIENDRRWHHGVIWGIAELSGPYNLKQICPNGWGEVKTETSFVNGLLNYLTSGIYAPQSVTIRCSGEEAPSDSDGTEGEESGGADRAAADSGKRTL